MTPIKISDYQELKKVLKRAAPDFRKNRAMIVQADQVTTASTKKHNGTAYEYVIATFIGSTCNIEGEHVSRQLLDTEIVIQSGLYHGKPSTMFIYGTKTALSHFGITTA